MKTIFKQLLFCALICMGCISSAEDDKAFNSNCAEAESWSFYSANDRWPTNLFELTSFSNARYANNKFQDRFSPEDYRTVGFTNLANGDLQLTLSAQSGKSQIRFCKRPPTTAMKVIQQDGYLIVQDGSSFYYFDKEKTFNSGPLNSWCGRGIHGSYETIAPCSFTAEGTMMYFNRPGRPTQYKMKMEVNSVERDSEPFDFKNLIFFVGYQKGKQAFPTNPVVHKAYFVFDYLVPTKDQKEPSQGVAPNAHRVAEDVVWQSMMKAHRQLVDEDIEGLCNYQSDQKFELEKFGYKAPVSLDTATFKSDVTKALLAALPSPEAFSNAPLEALRSVDRVQLAITKELISPAWIVNVWVDATRLASNGFDCSNQLQVLSILNCCAIRKRIADTSWGDALSHDLNERVRCRSKLFYAGYVTKFDKTFGIWRITGTNSPAERSQ